MDAEEEISELDAEYNNLTSKDVKDQQKENKAEYRKLAKQTSSTVKQSMARRQMQIAGCGGPRI